MFDGLYVNWPSEPPTMTLCTAPLRDTGVASGEPMYDEYTVVHDEASTVIVSVTTIGVGSAGIVTLPYAAVVQAPDDVDAAVAEAEALNGAPSARALLR